MNEVMEASYKFPQDDYALTILTNAANAMNNRNSDTTNPASIFDQQRPTSTTAITNPDAHHRRSNTSLSQSEGIRGSYNSIPAIRDMEALSYNQPERPSSYNPLGYLGLGLLGSQQIPNNSSNTLSILNTDTYDDGRSGMRSMRTKPSVDMVLPFGVEESRERRATEPRTDSEEPEKVPAKGKAKKRRNDSHNEDEEEEARKKARGRPRVDPKDETAADRRRTQIRMAQRAYRHRKETTITTLEKQVQDLRGTNEEMSNIFINLYDFAVGKGLLQREPEFGQQLQSTTQRFLALVKASQNDDESPEEHTKEADQTPPEPSRKAKNSRSTTKNTQEGASRSEEPVSNPWGGYTLMKEDSSTPAEEISMDLNQQNYQNVRQNDLQVITRPTEENASFPFEPFDLMDLQTYRVELPPIEDFSQNFLPPIELPLPNTGAFNEYSFARRLVRYTVEQGYCLLNMENPNQNRINEIFGFSLMYESQEQIKERLKACLEKSPKEPLSKWEAPFVHLGGAGTFYPMEGEDASKELMPKFRTGYSMGPFSSQVSQAQDYLLDDLRTSFPGFEGDFFDANDVEGYLRGRGIEIPPTADFITAELDLSEFTGPKSTSSGETAADVSPRTPQSPLNNLASRNPSITLDFSKPEPKAFPFPVTLYPDWSTTPDMNVIDPSLGRITELPDNEKSSSPTVATQENLQPQKQLVRVNVNILTHEMATYAVCLGRAPGYKPKDVNAAILAAIAPY